MHMVVRKVPGDNQDYRSLAKLFRALADPNRLRILQALMDEDMTEKVLVARLMSPQPRIARHLAYLKRVGFVKIWRKGRYAICSLNRDSSEMRSVFEWLIHWAQFSGLILPAQAA